MSENKIRHLPVVGDGKNLKGLVSRQRLYIKPDMLGSLNVWEISRYLSHLTVEKMMLKAENVITISQDKTVERAARVMSDNKIGSLPVIEENVVVGILSEIDLLKSFQQMLGLPTEGIRVTMRMPDRMGEFSKLTRVIADNGWGITGIGSFPSPKVENHYDMVMKITRVDLADVKKVLSQVPDQEVVDIREWV